MPKKMIWTSYWSRPYGRVMPLLSAAVPGFGTGLSLIAAIGAQNAFVLRQGILRRHVGTVVLVCVVSDALLILAGTAGMGALVEAAPWAMTAARLCGAAFLVGYAALALRRSLRPSALTVDAGGAGGASRTSALLTCLALTWLNPHVYLDTVVLLGSVASTHGATGRWAFAAGAIAASLVWFAAVGYGARGLRGLFARPVAWRILDAVVAVVMASIAWGLVSGI